MVLAFKKISTTTFIIKIKYSNMDLAQKTSISWQCDLSDNQQRLKYLFNTGQFSDIIIKCPGGNSFELHRMVLAMCSPVFEAMIFGPLATSKESLYLEDDSEAIKYVFSYIYGCGFQCDDIHVVLEIFKIADKYLINDLKNKLITVIQNLIKPESFKTIYDFTVKYDYNNLKSSCINFLQLDSNNTKAAAVLMWYSLKSPKDLLIPVFTVNKLIFDSWRNPKKVEPFDELVTLLESNYWHSNDLQEFAGQVSGDIIKYLPGPMRSSAASHDDPSYAPLLKFSLNKDNADEVMKALLERFKVYGPEDIGIHITNEDLPSLSGKLSRLPCYNCKINDDGYYDEMYRDLSGLMCYDRDSDNEIPIGRVTLYLSDITKENLPCIGSLLGDLKLICDNDHDFIYRYMFPKCNLTKEDFYFFSDDIFEGEYSFLPRRNCIWICSPLIENKYEEDLTTFARKSSNYIDSEMFPFFHLTSNDNEIPGW